MKATSNMYCETQVLQVLLNREGLYYRVEKATVEECLESLSDRAAAHQIWLVIYLLNKRNSTELHLFLKIDMFPISFAGL